MIVAETAAPAVELAQVDEIVEGVSVSFPDPDGNPVTGIVVGVGGLADTPPTVTVAPDDDPENPVVIPLDQVEVTDLAGADDAGEGEDAPEIEVEVEVEDEAPEPKFDVVEDHPECSEDAGGTVAVIIYEDGNTEGEGRVDSCWSDTDAAQAHIEEILAAGDEAPVEEDAAADLFATEGDDDKAAPDDEDKTVFVGETTLEEDSAEAASERSGLSELEHAAALADRVRETMELLHSIKPTAEKYGLDVPVEGERFAFSPLSEKPETTATDEAATLSTEEPAVAENKNTDELASEDRDPEEILAVVNAAREEASDEDDKGDEDEAVETEEDETGTALSTLSEQDLLDELARRFVAEKLASVISTAESADGSVTAGEVLAEGESSGEAVQVEAVTAATDDAVEAAEDVPAPAEDQGAEDDDTVQASGDFDWEGVLIVEGLPSGDGRQIAEGALTWRELPVALMLQTVNAAGHDGAIICGSIHKIERDGQNILGFGKFDSGAAGQEALRLLSEGTMRGVSADIDSVVVEFLSENGDVVSIEDVMMGGVEAMEVLVEGRIMGATLCPFPAFQEAHVKVISSDQPDEAMVASGADYRGDVWRVSSPIGMWPAGGDRPASIVASAALQSLVASAAAEEIVDVPANPPAEWFGQGEMVEPQPFTVYPDGRCYGLVARFGSCHIGFTDRCVDVPRTGCAYKHFRNKSVKTEEGTLVATGPIFMDTVHPNLRLLASDAQAHYAHTGCAVADVALYENEYGIVAAGALRPGLTEAQVRTFRGSDVSPDWRKIGGRLEIVGLLSVNVSGFVVEGLVASGAEISAARGRYDTVAGECTALVAAGMVHKADFEQAEKEQTREALASLTDQVTEMHSALEALVLAPAREKRLAEARAKLGLADPEEARKAKADALFASMGIEAANPLEGGKILGVTLTADEGFPGSSVTVIEDPAEASVEIVSEDGSIEVVAHGDEAVAEVLEAFSDESDCGGSCGGSEGACACEH